MSSKKNSDKETFSLPKTVSLFGTQKALQKLVDMRGEKQYNEANMNQWGQGMWLFPFPVGFTKTGGHAW